MRDPHLTQAEARKGGWMKRAKNKFPDLPVRKGARVFGGIDIQKCQCEKRHIYIGGECSDSDTHTMSLSLKDAIELRDFLDEAIAYVKMIEDQP